MVASDQVFLPAASSSICRVYRSPTNSRRRSIASLPVSVRTTASAPSASPALRISMVLCSSTSFCRVMPSMSLTMRRCAESWSVAVRITASRCWIKGSERRYGSR
ncbi:hypothetical protein D9M69_690020 [compost metagenome]